MTKITEPKKLTAGGITLRQIEFYRYDGKDGNYWVEWQSNGQNGEFSVVYFDGQLGDDPHELYIQPPATTLDKVREVIAFIENGGDPDAIWLSDGREKPIDSTAS